MITQCGLSADLKTYDSFNMECFQMILHMLAKEMISVKMGLLTL